MEVVDDLTRAVDGLLVIDPLALCSGDEPTRPERSIDAMDVLRCRIRWRTRHWFGDGDEAGGVEDDDPG